MNWQTVVYILYLIKKLKYKYTFFIERSFYIKFFFQEKYENIFLQSSKCKEYFD